MVAITQDRFNRLVAQIYEASLEEDAWPVLVDELGRFFGDAAVGVSFQSSNAISQPEIISSRFDTSLVKLASEAYWTPEDNPGIAALLREPVGKPFSFSSFIDQKTYDSDPSIQAILKPQKLNQGMLAVLNRDDQALDFMNVYRCENQPEIDKDELKAFGQIAHHIMNSKKLRQLSSLRQWAGQAAACRLEQGNVALGFLVIGSGGQVDDADPMALVILKQNRCLGFSGSRLVSFSQKSGQDSKSLNNFVNCKAGVETFVIQGKDGEYIRLDKMRLGAVGAGLLNVSGQLLSIRLLRMEETAQLEAFNMVFGLTEAEGRVVQALTQSVTATEAAKNLKIGRETMKTHLSHIYAKTGVASLSQLLFMAGRFSE